MQCGGDLGLGGDIEGTSHCSLPTDCQDWGSSSSKTLDLDEAFEGGSKNLKVSLRPSFNVIEFEAQGR